MSTISISSNDIEKGLSSNQQVTNYAQASITLVPNLSSPPDWYKPIDSTIQKIKTNSSNWINSICPLSSKKIPSTITNFNPCFQKESAALLSLLQIINNQSVGPTSAQVTESQKVLQTLLDNIKIQKSAVSDAHNKTLLYIESVIKNQSSLSKGIGTIEKNIEKSAGNIIKIEALITDKFLNSSILGPCNAIVNVDVNISIQINEISTDPDLIAYIYTKAFLKKQIANLSDSKQYIQDFLDLWTQIESKYSTVWKNIAAARADKLVPFLESLDLKNAQIQWDALAQYVKESLGN